MLLADQDTCFPVDIFDRYHEARRAEPDSHLFAPILVDDMGIVSPFKLGIVGGKRLKSITPGKMNLRETCAINSGLLLSVDLFERAGGYDERIRLDFSDHNFFRKLRPLVSQFITLDIICRHTLSSSRDAKLKDALSRFIIYIEGSRTAGREFGNALLFECYAFLRAVKLSWRYRSFRFVGSLLRSAS